MKPRPVARPGGRRRIPAPARGGCASSLRPNDASPRTSAVRGEPAQPAADRRFHVRRDLGRLRVRGLRGRYPPAPRRNHELPLPRGRVMNRQLERYALLQSPPSEAPIGDDSPALESKPYGNARRCTEPLAGEVLQLVAELFQTPPMPRPRPRITDAPLSASALLPPTRIDEWRHAPA